MSFNELESNPAYYKPPVVATSGPSVGKSTLFVEIIHSICSPRREFTEIGSPPTNITPDYYKNPNFAL